MVKTKKAPLKKSVRTVTKKSEVRPMQPFFKDKKFVSIFLGIIVVGLLAFALPLLRNFLFAASVNGKPRRETGAGFSHFKRVNNAGRIKNESSCSGNRIRYRS